MARNLDIAALRALVTVADTGGVTRAAGFLSLTQSAVSMQLKRLEESLGLALFDRSGRGIALTPSGEQLVSYARRMVALNDDIYGRLGKDTEIGTIRLGAPHDLVYKRIPSVLKQFNAGFPRMRLQLVTALTVDLHEAMSRGELDMMLTTDAAPRPESETLATLPLVWVGAPDGVAWRRCPIPIATEPHCIFRQAILRALDDAGLPWEISVVSTASRSVEAGVEADLAVYAQMSGLMGPTMEPIPHGGALPDLPAFCVNFTRAEGSRGAAADALADMVRAAYGAPNGTANVRPFRPALQAG